MASIYKDNIWDNFSYKFDNTIFEYEDKMKYTTYLKYIIGDTIIAVLNKLNIHELTMWAYTGLKG